MKFIIWTQISLLVSIVTGSLDKVELSEENKLIKSLLDRYKYKGTLGRPVTKYNETVVINYNIQLVQIMGLDEKNQVLTLNVWDRYIWNDIHLVWDPEKHGGVDTIRIPPHEIWIPDIKLYNYADDRLAVKRDVLCVINHTGAVLWMPQTIYKSSCEIDVSSFPFDIQNCSLKFGSWAYSGNLVDLMILMNDTGHTNGTIDMLEYLKSNSWKVLHTKAIRHNNVYTCCPEPFIDLSFTIIFQRRSTFYNYILILPCILLTSLTLVLFWIPPESPAKLTLGINIFVAFFFLLLVMEKNLPPSAAKVPLLGTFYCLNMIIITLSSFLNAFVVNLSFYGSRRPLPNYLRMVMFDFFAKILFMETVVSPFRDKTISELTSQIGKDRMPFLGVPVNGDKTSKWVRSGNRSSGDSPMIDSSHTDIDLQQLMLHNINLQLGELVEFLKSYRARSTDKDRKDRVAREWKAVGLIFDRIFFQIYLIAITASLCVILPIITQPEINLNMS